MAVPRFRSEVFLRQDIESILRAIDSANRHVTDLMPEYEVAIYRAGFTAAVHDIALALHISLEPEARSFRVVEHPAYEIEITGR